MVESCQLTEEEHTFAGPDECGGFSSVYNVKIEGLAGDGGSCSKLPYSSVDLRLVGLSSESSGNFCEA